MTRPSARNVLRFFVPLVVVLLAGAFAGAASQQPSDVRVLSQTSDGMEMVYVPAYSPLEKIAANGQMFTSISFAGNGLADGLTAGVPQLASRTLTIEVPGAEGVRVEIVSADYEDIGDILLLPVPSLKDNEGVLERTYKADPAVYGVAGFLPESIASLERVGESRGVVLAGVRITPVQYNPATRTLRKYSRIVLRVHFGSHDRVLASPDPMMSGIAINGSETAVKGAAPTKTVSSADITQSVLARGEWFRIPVTEDGMYKLTGRTLLDAGIPSSVNPQSIRLFGNGGRELPTSIAAPYTHDLLENAVLLKDQSVPNQLDPDDQIIFYGKGVRSWAYNPADRQISHYLNHFTETNYYWLTYGDSAQKPMAVAPSLAEANPVRPATVTGKIFREDEKVNILQSGMEWLGQTFNPGESITYMHPLPGLDASQPVNYRFMLGGGALSTSSFMIEEHRDTMATPFFSGTSLGEYWARHFIGNIVTRSAMPSFTDGQSRLRFSFKTGSSGGKGYLDWYEIFYQRFLQASDDLLSFHTKDTTMVAEYVVSGFSSNDILIFDVSRFDSVYRIGDAHLSGDSCTFQVQLTSGRPRELYAVGPGGFKTPGALKRMPNQNLHGDTTRPEYIIITPSAFSSAAQRLKAHREQPGADYLRTLIVDVEQIYNEFGGGLPMPAAIRNYLRYRYQNDSPPPRYVLFLGDGDYDYKRITASGPNWIPAWETPESYIPINSYATEDDFVILTAGNRVNMAGGRLAAQTASEAQTMVSKVIEYEQSVSGDAWKLRTTFVADDGLVAGGFTELFTHLYDAEGVSELTPPLFEKRKIYLHEYPAVYTPGGRRKPAVNQAIIDQINEGTLVLNFNGHGNPRLWTHEAVFVRESDFPFLRNKGRYFFLVAATCNYSAFDAINDQSGGEMLVAMPDAGAIAVLSATRAVYQISNYELNRSMYRNLFPLDNFGRVIPRRLGDALFRTKQERAAENDRKFFLLGDPASRLGVPQLFASIDSLNNVPSTQVFQLPALGKTSLRASVRDSSMGILGDYTGKGRLTVFDANRRVEVEDFRDTGRGGPPERVTTTFVAPGAIIFRGEQTITDGLVSANFIVPKDISYSNDFGRISIYFWNSTVDGAGYTTSVRVGGTDSSAAADNEGPEIALYFDHKGFRSGDVVGATPLLIAELRDEHGINTSGAGVGHRLEAWLDDQPESIDLTNYYQSNTDRFDEGTVEYSFRNLTEGTHTLRMRAWDTYNNASTSEAVFNVVSGEGLSIASVLNYPNPFSSSTIFTVEHNQVGGVDVDVKIYTVAGRLIQSLSLQGSGSRLVKIPWDGRDREGDVLANGIYLYKVVLKAQHGRFSSEAFGKLSIVR